MAKQKIVISERDNIAVLFEDERAVEFIIHRGDVLLGDVYLAQVENILPSIDAAFVHVGTERMGFLHSSDVQGKGDLKNRLQPKQNVVVQVMKEPTGHKGPRVTTNIALPGRFLVLMPESKGISISRKIAEPKERARLKSILSLMKPPGVGVIIRTEAENQSDPEIQEDFETLIERWQNIVAMADTAKPPVLLYRDQDLLYRVIREMVTEDVKEIVVDTAFGQQRAQQLIQNWGIEHPVKVTQYTGPQSIMIGCNVDKEIKQALQTRVPLASGGYLFIQPTEALTVVDVNSGKFTSLASQAETIRLTNLEAAKEIARQLRLRNIGGMIVVDFIDMESRANQLSVLEFFEMELIADKAKPQIGQLSDLGLVEMTRHRQGQALGEIFGRKCVSCTGSGQIVEDFNWAPTGGETGRAAQNRSKFPVRSGPPSGVAPGQAAPAGGQSGPQRQGGQKGPLPKPGQPSLRKLIDPRAQHQQPLREGFLQQAKDVAEHEEKLKTENMPFDELYTHRLVKKYGIRLANSAKVSSLPLETNSIMVRINPKANDVFTLVQAIEGSAYMPPDSDDEFDESESDASDMDGEREPEFEPQPRRRQDSRPAATAPSELEHSADELAEVAADDDDPIAAQTEEFEPLEETATSEDGGAPENEEAAASAPRRRGRPPIKSRNKVAVTGRQTTLPIDDEGEVDGSDAAAPRRRGRPPKARPTQE